MDKSEEQLETMATYVHGSLAALHGVALIHNIKRRNIRDSIVHAAFLGYDVLASYRHYKYKSQ